MLARNVIIHKLETVDVLAHGHLAIEIGRMTFTVQPAGAAESSTIHGRSIVVWRRQPDGSLKIWADIFNSDTPN